MSVSSLAHLVALCLTPGIGGVTLRNLLQHFASAEAILAADPADLERVSGIGPRTVRAIQQADPRRTEGALARWAAQGIQPITWSHPAYPTLLDGLRDAPPILFCRGALLPTHTQAVAIVGTRTPTPASRALSETLGHELAQRGWSIVSGLAWGVDVAAHGGAVQAGRTVAVLGGGLGKPQSGAKKALAETIIHQGALLSEVSPDAEPSRTALVARNRIISGMSRAVIVVEAGESSGSLYTARFARQQKRALFAVTNASPGNRQILADGAQPLPPQDIDWDALAHTLDTLPDPAAADPDA